METPAASDGLDQAIHVGYPDGVVPEAYPWFLKPPDPTHPGLGCCGVALDHAVDIVQQGVLKSADVVGV